MLEDAIKDIGERLARSDFPNEASVSMGVVLRLLGVLDWPVHDPKVVYPEFPDGEGGRVDFALCHPSGQPRVFVEVKKLGRSDGAERQLFSYAYHHGIQLVVLTDGQDWSFFLPGEAGNYSERRVYKLDLVERDVHDSAERLRRYLTYRAVCTGEALSAARADYQDVAKERQIDAALPQAWRGLVDEQDELLIELIADRVENLCGFKPDPEVTLRFLKNDMVLRTMMAGQVRVVATAQPERPVHPEAAEVSRQTSAGTSHRVGFAIAGEFRSCHSAVDVLVKVIEALAERDPLFIEKFIALPRHGTKRRWVARDRYDLYPGRPDLAERHSYHLSTGEWVGTNYNPLIIEKIIATACQVAGLGYGRDMTASLG